jgi:ribosomal protein S18 acetylase RimI-like enzyme
MPVAISVRPAAPEDVEAIAGIHTASWGGSVAVGHGVAYDLTTLPTLVAVEDDRIAGVLTYHVDGDSLEVVSIDASPPRRGVGTALLDAAAEAGRALGLRRMWLITTNDNLDALRFYQRRGLRLVGLAPDGVAASRRLKPGIPEVGAYGIPLRDELTLELSLEVRVGGADPTGPARG